MLYARSVFLLSLAALTTGCMVPRDGVQNFPLSKVVKEKDRMRVAYQEFLHFQDCDELFLEFGYDTTRITREGEPRTEAEQAFDRCKTTTPDESGSEFPRPALAVALSGGGTRSASFSVGALKALDEEQYLDNTNTISSVSGGSYAHYWFLMQRYFQYLNAEQISATSYESLADQLRSTSDRGFNSLASFCSQLTNTETRNHTMDDIFRTHAETPVNGSYVFQEHLSNQSDIVNYSESVPIQYLETTGLIASHVGLLPFYWVTDGLLDTNAFNGSVLTNAYRKGLERTYGFSPNMEFDSYYDYFDHAPEQFHNAMNGRILRWRENARAVNLNFRELRHYMAVYNTCVSELQDQGTTLPRQPLPIINATVKPDFSFFQNPDYRDMHALEKLVYSMSPIEYGSELEGYQFDSYLFMPISFSKAVAVSGAAADENARQSNWATDSLLRVFNLNLGYDIRNPRTQYGYLGSAWFWASKAVNGIPLGFMIPQDSKPTIHISDGGGSENLGAFSLVRRGVKRIIIVDGEHDSGYNFDGLKRLQANLKGNYHIKMDCFSYRDGKPTDCPLSSEFINETASPVMRMKIYAPWDRHFTEALSEVLYIKLSINRDMADKECTPSLAEYRKTDVDLSDLKYPCTVYRFYKNDRDGRDGQFPHNTTADIWYEKEQYEAYRDLGYHVTKLALREMRTNPIYNSWNLESIQRDNQLRKNYVDAMLQQQAVRQAN